MNPKLKNGGCAEPKRGHVRALQNGMADVRVALRKEGDGAPNPTAGGGGVPHFRIAQREHKVRARAMDGLLHRAIAIKLPP
ncbi:MAG TPA: hypothetical protein VFY06_12155 [Verrucomicrobiae bacterium]|nr:hypothetical protein [Verrucomicrobiae bacterium]